MKLFKAVMLNKGTSKNQIRKVPLGTFKVKIIFFEFFNNEKSNF
jgi:hypothetical protein